MDVLAAVLGEEEAQEGSLGRRPAAGAQPRRDSRVTVLRGSREGLIISNFTDTKAYRKLLAAFRPSPDALLDVLRTRTDDTILHTIAKADYGMHAEKHLRELVRIRDTGHIPFLIPWVPVEVLALTRNGDPDDPRYERPAGIDRLGHHTMRVFACACLLREATDPIGRDYSDGVSNSLYQLIESAAVLGMEVQEATASFLAWGITRMCQYEDRCHVAYALLTHAVNYKGTVYSEDLIAGLADWVLWEGARKQRFFSQPNWRLRAAEAVGLSLYLWRQSWRPFAQRMLDQAETIQSQELKLKLQALAVQVTASA